MSTHKHPTLSAWHRDEDGHYTAEISGWQLHVRWRPEQPRVPRGFLWEATRGDLKLAPRGDVHEEIELAMAAAEAATAAHP